MRYWFFFCILTAKIFNVLEFLSSHDDRWLGIACMFLGNTQDAKDMVQDFYIRCYDADNIKDNQKIGYYTTILTNMCKDKLKNKRNDLNDSVLDFVSLEDELFEIDDDGLKYLERSKKLSDEDLELLISNYDKPMHQLAADRGECYINTYRNLNNSRIVCLREDFSKKYKNKRLKYKNDERKQ